MRFNIVAFALLGFVVASPSDVPDIEDASPEHVTYCIAYESTYLVPVPIGTNSSEPSSFATEEPGFVASDSTNLPPFTSTKKASTSITTGNTEQPSSPTDDTIAPPALSPRGKRVIFLVTPFGELTKRDVGSFVGKDNPDVCTFATVYVLGQGRLFEGNFPISYSGEDFQQLHSSTSPGADSITTTFGSEGGVLGFSNPSLPGGRASFCQTPSDGQVYITYNSKPSGCVFITLNIYEVERCINGKIDGLETTTYGLSRSDSVYVTTDPSADITMSNTPETEVLAISESSKPDNTDDLSFTRSSDAAGIVFPTLSIASTGPWNNQTSITSTLFRGSDIPTSIDDMASNTDLAPSSTSREGSISEHPLEPSSSTTPVFVKTEDLASRSGELSSSEDLSNHSDVESSTTETSAATGDLNSSDTLVTTMESRTVDSTRTSTDTTTTTQEPALVARSVTRNGNFAISDPNSPSSVEGWTIKGEAIQSNGDGYKGDGSTDNGCVILTVSGVTDARRKRATVSSSIEQVLTGLDTTVEYTVQFYYLVTGTSNTGSCQVIGRAGLQEFYSEDIYFSESSTPWEKAIGTVMADVEEAPLVFSLSCTGGGRAKILVDSVFASNEVTPSNIDDYELDYGDEGN
ncbi:hypothetical protein FVEN_g892 [Fusarium venenatum]|uniref:DUF7908 domain-containing protein n=1 Tax=Fusarium venenatum TaxID=56646 RepID=A0A2L2TKE5_9HYPO|nr:uncharacterized protein FVRRES_10695 [Fusarium venenatum]KAG8361098.1 hypothetical protein FVEN_g892 [Fusarium venenatum]CEI70618.1 unnamed protein product [Fusarium venenatum]